MRPKLTQDEFIQKIFNKYGNEYSVLGKYVNSKTKVLFRHNCERCSNYEFEMTPNHILSTENRKCPKCSR